MSGTQYIPRTLPLLTPKFRSQADLLCATEVFLSARRFLCHTHWLEGYLVLGADWYRYCCSICGSGVGLQYSHVRDAPARMEPAFLNVYRLSRYIVVFRPALLGGLVALSKNQTFVNGYGIVYTVDGEEPRSYKLSRIRFMPIGLQFDRPIHVVGDSPTHPDLMVFPVAYTRRPKPKVPNGYLIHSECAELLRAVMGEDVLGRRLDEFVRMMDRHWGEVVPRRGLQRLILAPPPFWIRTWRAVLENYPDNVVWWMSAELDPIDLAELDLIICLAACEDGTRRDHLLGDRDDEACLLDKLPLEIKLMIIDHIIYRDMENVLVGLRPIWVPDGYWRQRIIQSDILWELSAWTRRYTQEHSIGKWAEVNWKFICMRGEQLEVENTRLLNRRRIVGTLEILKRRLEGVEMETEMGTGENGRKWKRYTYGLLRLGLPEGQRRGDYAE
ncbi:hypothetical protein FQN55_003435 [Onygenales sp. PD_40]|nr:hypothetical protein FQN55_003435 [Onygenales sp. PD_40]